MKPFDEMLEQEIAKYEGRHDDLIFQGPALYRLLVRLLDDHRLPLRLRPAVSCAIAYFILPGDVLAEEIYGPYGYVDDIWLCAYTADLVQREAGVDDILSGNWDGECPIGALVADILARERDLIGDGRGKILWYTGFDQLLAEDQVG